MLFKVMMDIPFPLSFAIVVFPVPLLPMNAIIISLSASQYNNIKA